MDQQVHLSDEKPIVFFDGVCNLCNAAVQFILKRERSPSLLFAPLQGETFRNTVHEQNLPDSIVLWEKGSLYTESSAVLRIAQHLRQPWPFLAAAGKIFPEFLRNAVYRLVARLRYRWFGKRESCYLPTPELRARFLP